MEFVFNDDNTPNAGKFITSLRKVGYDNYSALMDLVDNSVDAGARTVEISVYHRDKETEFIIADDGSGMDRKILDQALRLGSETDKVSGALGKFGMGLSTATLSICRRTMVFTKLDGEKQWLAGVIDTDQIVMQNRFTRAFSTAGTKEVAAFLERGKVALNPEHGTVILLTNCDQVTNNNTNVFTNILKKRLGQTYRQFIENGLKIIVNGTVVEAEDPLYRKTDGTEIWIDDWFDIETPVGKENVLIRMALIPDFGVSGNKEHGINIPNQGIYVLRNNREIATGWWIFHERKHNIFNRFRAELHFSNELDDVMGVNFAKRGIEPTQSIIDQLKNILEPQLTGVSQRVKKAQRASGEDNTVDHSDAEKQIAGKAALLTKPSSSLKTRDVPEGEHTPKHHPKRSKDVETNTSESKPKIPSPICRFEYRHMEPGGVIFEPYLEGKVTVIAWNLDHPFYERFLAEYAGERGIVSAVDFLVYSLAVAELRAASDEEKMMMMIEFRSVLSNNLRILLS